MDVNSSVLMLVIDPNYCSAICRKSTASKSWSKIPCCLLVNANIDGLTSE